MKKSTCVAGYQQLSSTEYGTFFHVKFYPILLPFLHKQSLCYSKSSLFSNLSLKYCCDLNIVATKVIMLINNQLLSTANAKDINTDYYITNSPLASRYRGSVA